MNDNNGKADFDKIEKYLVKVFEGSCSWTSNDEVEKATRAAEALINLERLRLEKAQFESEEGPKKPKLSTLGKPPGGS